MENMIFSYNNPHPEKKIVGDCVVRAVVIARGTDYLEQRLELQRFNRKVKGKSYKNITVLRKYLKELGFEWVPFQAVKGQPRMRGTDFVKLYPKGTYILNLARHIVAVVDGVFQDTWDSTNKVVYGMWKVNN